MMMASPLQELSSGMSVSALHSQISYFLLSLTSQDKNLETLRKFTSLVH